MTKIKTLVFIMAGGQGKRLYPLTRDRAKPAVPFGGVYRIIDFTLSNCINSNLRQVFVLTQYQSISLSRHIKMGWSYFHREFNEFIDILPAHQQLDEERWYAGTADSIYQNIDMLNRLNPENVLILAGDHIYKMNYQLMINSHQEKNADVTIGIIEMPKESAFDLGVLEIDKNNKIENFEEKPVHPKTIPNKNDKCYVSMGIYMFKKDILVQRLKEDAKLKTVHDFGKNIIPYMVFAKDKVYGYPFVDENKKEIQYWRDIGTIYAYWESNMDIVSVDPHLNLYDADWPIYTYHDQVPPAKTVFSNEEKGRLGICLDSLVSEGCIISGGKIQNCILSPNVRVNSYCEVQESVIMEGVDIGRYSKIKKAIIDKFVRIPPNTVIGYDLEKDKKRFFISNEGIVIIPREWSYL